MTDEPQIPVPQGVATVDTVAEPPMDFTVIATDPAGMVEAQKSLIAWSDRKMEAENQELAEAQRNLASAKAHKWSTTAWAAQVKKIEKRVDYYAKIKLALEAGYYIVPPFPIDLFAIRTKASGPRPKWLTVPYRDQHEQKASILPAGEGRYVSPDPVVDRYDLTESDGKGGTKLVPRWRPEEFREADFPFRLAKAEIMHATRAAMALKIFDQLGALPTHRAPDPIICGQILMPNRASWDRRAVTFFVAWWLDTKTI